MSQPQSQTARVFLGNLPFHATVEDVLGFLSPRQARVRVITDRDTGRSRGFGFAEMSIEDAKSAIEELHEVAMDGRPVIVSRAHERDVKPDGANGRRSNDRDRGEGRRDSRQGERSDRGRDRRDSRGSSGQR